MAKETADKPIGFVQTSFAGGINTFVSPNIIDDSEYVAAVNVRTRRGQLTSIKRPKNINGVPGKVQGLYAAGRYLISFIKGQAYYYDLESSTNNWTRIEGLLMDVGVDRIYAQLVPESFDNFERVAQSPDSTEAVRLSATNSNTPACLVIQDGQGSPRIIFPNATTRIAKSYAQWSRESREYIPIGTLMQFHNGKLYVVNGKKIYSSVTGRPLDFVINVTSTGDKGGDADTFYHTVDYNDIIALGQLNGKTDGSGLYVGSASTSTAVIPDLNNLLFAEPKFNNGFLFDTGPVGPYAVGASLNDYVLIDINGVRSFNATEQLQTSSNSDIFSAPVIEFFEGVGQTSSACVGSFANYLLFSVNTKNFGTGVLVYDMTYQKFVSFDKYTGVVGQLKQFATTKHKGRQRIFAYDEANNIFELFAGVSTEDITLYSKAVSTNDSKNFVGIETISLSLLNNTVDGIINAQLIVDDKPSGPIRTQNAYANQPLVSFDFSDSAVGYSARVKLTISLQDAAINALTIGGKASSAKTSIAQKANVIHRWNP